MSAAAFDRLEPASFLPKRIFRDESFAEHLAGRLDALGARGSVAAPKLALALRQRRRSRCSLSSKVSSRAEDLIAVAAVN